MKKSSIILLVCIIGLVSAQQKPATRTLTVPKKAESAVTSGSFFGSIFSDYSYVFQEPQTGNPSAGASGSNRFLIRRASIGYGHQFSKDIAATIEYDAGGGGLLQANAEIKNIVSQLDMKMGMMKNVSAETMEKIWEYRSLNSFVLERNGLLHEYDNGVMLTGRNNAQGILYARLGAFNGNGTAPESDKIKKFVFAAGNWFDRSSVLEVYADYENVGFGRSTISAKLFYGMKTQSYALGVEGFYRMNRKFAGTSDVTPFGGSAFAWFAMVPYLRGILRADFVDNDLNASNVGFRTVYVVAGIDYAPVPEIHVIPNFIYNKQLKKGSTPVNADILEARITAAVSFPSFK